MREPLLGSFWLYLPLKLIVCLRAQLEFFSLAHAVSLLLSLSLCLASKTHCCPICSLVCHSRALVLCPFVKLSCPLESGRVEKLHRDTRLLLVAPDQPHCCVGDFSNNGHFWRTGAKTLPCHGPAWQWQFPTRMNVLADRQRNRLTKERGTMAIMARYNDQNQQVRDSETNLESCFSCQVHPQLHRQLVIHCHTIQWTRTTFVFPWSRFHLSSSI